MIEFNRGQKRVIQEAVTNFKTGRKQVFQFTGNAGTGKSVVLAEIIRELGLGPDEIAPMAYTGTATNVMRAKGLINAKTIHSTLYEVIETPMVDKNGHVIMDTYLDKPKMVLQLVPKPIPPGIKLFIIDEASMVPYSMKAEIESRGIPIIATGDLDQLPPVADQPAYLIGDDILVLDEIMRQAENSPIVYLSQRAKHNLPIHCGRYGDQVYVVERENISLEMLANTQIVLCGKNKTRDEILNPEIRKFKGYSGMLPQYGEKLICRKNNHFIMNDGIFLSNGTIGYALNNPDVSGMKSRGTFTLDFMPFFGQRPFTNLTVDLNYWNAPFELKSSIKRDPFSKGEKFEFAYAITTHLSQGAEYDNGIYYEEFLNSNIQRNLNYTAITRFRNSLIYVKPPVKKYF